MVVEVAEGEKGAKMNQMVLQMEGNLFVVVDDDLFLVSCGLLVKGHYRVHPDKLLQMLLLRIREGG